MANRKYTRKHKKRVKSHKKKNVRKHSKRTRKVKRKNVKRGGMSCYKKRQKGGSCGRQHGGMSCYKKRQKGGSCGCQHGGSSGLKPVPFVPPGGMYRPGHINGLTGGYYYGDGSSRNGPGAIMPESSTVLPLPRQKGGSFIQDIMPQDLLNLGRNIEFGFKHIYNNFSGQQTPLSDNPNSTSQGLENKRYIPNVPSMPDIQSHSNEAAAQFSKF